jgi:hypothetical protein
MREASDSHAKGFLRRFAASCAGILCLWCMVVLAFDPFLAFGTRLLPQSIIQSSSRMLGDEQLIKDHIFSRVRPESIIIGSSRSAYGLDPQSPHFSGERTLNLAMLGASLTELEGLAAQARRNKHHIKRLVVGLDHYMFFQPAPESKHNEAINLRTNRMEEGYGFLPLPLRYIQTFMLSAKLSKVMEDILDNWRRKDTKGEADLNGLMHGTYRFRIADRSRTFEVTLLNLLQQGWYANPDESTIRSRLQRLAAVLRSTCQAGIKSDVILSPEHAMLYEAASLSGQQNQRAQLRRDIARLMLIMSNEQPECIRYRDASGLSEPALEPLRIAVTTPPQFIEVSHYAPVVGERVLLGFIRPDDPKALGIDPAKGGLEADIAASFSLLDRWRRETPEDVVFVKRVYDASRVK